MIGFLEPLALVGLAACGIPALLHLRARRTPPTVTFPAIRYLAATEQEYSRRLKLRNLLLLLLRTAAIALVVLAAARPVARVGAGRDHPRTAVGLVVDNSLSAGAVTAGRPTVAVLAERARRVLAQLDPHDALWVLLADGVPREMSRAEAGMLLDTLTAWPIRLDIGEAARRLERVLREAGRPAAVIVVASDLQVSALSGGSPVATRVVVLEPPPLPENRALDSVRVEPAIWFGEGQILGQVRGNLGGPVAVRVREGARDLARAVVGSGDPFVVRVRLAEPGWHSLRVALDPDELRGDDVRAAAVYVAQPARVLLGPGVGTFVTEAVEVLASGGRVRLVSDPRGAVVLDDRPASPAQIVLPPREPALVGAANRALAALGSSWRWGERVVGEWFVSGDLLPGGATVYRRYRLTGRGTVLMSVQGEPWVVRERGVVLVGSRFEEDWTSLPVSAGFLPFLDALLNRVAARPVSVARAAPGEPIVLGGEVRRIVLDGDVVAVPPDGRLAAPGSPGVYYLIGAAGDTVGALEVNVDPGESDLRVATRQALGQLSDTVRFAGEAPDARMLFGTGGRTELAGVCLFLALVAACGELVVATVGSRARGGGS